MKLLKLALLAGGASLVPAFPAFAQHAGHTAQAAPAATPAPASTCLPEHAAMGHCTLPAPSQPPKASNTCTPEHAAMGHCKMPATVPAVQQPKPPAKTTLAPDPACTPEHAAMGHCTMPTAPKTGNSAASPEVTAPATAPASTCSPEHAAMGHCTLPETPSAPVSGRATPAAQAPACTAEHAAMGHCTLPTGTSSADPHAGHQMPGSDPMAGHISEAAGTNLPAGIAPPPPVPTANAADAIFGREAMDMGRHHLNEHHGGQKFYQVMANIAEYQFRKGRDGYEWDASAWYGGDINRLWLKSEGEGTVGRGAESAEVQTLYSRAFSSYFNVQGGVRYDFKPKPNRAYAVLGVEGLAPSFFDVEGTLFLSNKGELFARAEGYYDQRITQRLILQPSIEMNFAAQNSRELGIGAGLSDAEIGLRLRYDVRREFAPYVGVKYSRAFGNTRKYLRDEGEEPGGWSLLTGIRAWF